MNLNILLISSDNVKSSGAFLCMHEIAKSLKDNYGDTVSVVLPYKGNGQEMLENSHIDYTVVRSYDAVYKYGTPKNLVYYFELVSKIILNLIAVIQIMYIIAKKKIDVVHINTSYTYVGAVAALMMKKPYVWHIREFGLEDQGNIYYLPKAMYFLMNKSKKVICISNSIKEKFATFLDKADLCIVYDGLDPQIYRTDKKLFQNPTPTFLIVGTIKKTKGQEFLLKACTLLKTKSIDFVLLIAGDGPEEEKKRLYKIIQDGSLSNQVEFLGFMDDIASVHAKADILFMCSSSEAFGRVTVEGMMSGSLIIGSNQGCTREIISDGYNGYLYEHGNINDLTNVIIKALRDKQNSSIIAQNGQDHAINCFSLRRNISSIREIYYEVIGNEKKNYS